jgi:N-methylhydantoinase B
MYSGYDKKGEWYQLYMIGFGGVPGKPMGDGPDGHSLWPSFTNVPNEFLESYFPLVIEEYYTVPDSGGAGYHRGGNALCTTYKFLEPGEVSIHDDRWLTYPWGVNGGHPGARSTKTLVRNNGDTELLQSQRDRIKVEDGDILYHVTWGGGGWGDPFTREPERVAFDVDAGLATREGAKKNYGVVLGKDCSINKSATTQLRKRMAKARGKTKLFDKGFTSVTELKQRCKEETGLEPPATPKFQKWMQA